MAPGAQGRAAGAALLPLAVGVVGRARREAEALPQASEAVAPERAGVLPASVPVAEAAQLQRVGVVVAQPALDAAAGLRRSVPKWASGAPTLEQREMAAEVESALEAALAWAAPTKAWPEAVGPLQAEAEAARAQTTVLRARVAQTRAEEAAVAAERSARLLHAPRT